MILVYTSDSTEVGKRPRPFANLPSAALASGSVFDPVQGLVLPGGGVADGFDVDEDRGAWDGGAGGPVSRPISSRKKCPRQP